jgi:integrase
MTLQQLFFRVYLAERPDVKSGTIQNYQAAIRRFGRWLRRPPRIADLQRATIIAFLAALDGTLAARTINNHRASLLTLWRAAAVAGLADEPPRIANRRMPRRLPIVWTLDELKAIFAAADRTAGNWAGVPRRLCWRLLLALLWDTGTRIGTACDARLADVDLRAGRWFVPAENLKGCRADVMFRLHASTVELIRQSMIAPRKYLIPLPRCRQYLHECFGDLLASAGLPNDRRRKFHCIRRTAATYAAAAMGTVWAAAAIGHSVAVAEASYIHPAFVSRPALVDALPRPF